MFRGRSRWLGIAIASALWLAPLALFSFRSPFGIPAMAVERQSGRGNRKGGGRGGTEGQVWSRSPAVNFANLRSLPYILQAFDPQSDQSGVVVHRKGLPAPGVNFFFPWSWKPPKAYLMDLDGRILWRWSLVGFDKQKGHPWLEHAELLRDGSVVWSLKDRGIVKVDRDSRVVWDLEIRAHHDIWPADNGDLYVLTRERSLVPDIHPTIPIESDAITIVSSDGRLLKRIPFLDLLRRSGYAYLLPRLQSVALEESVDALDVFHANHLELLDGRLASRSPILRRGNLLFSIRNLSVIGIMDGQTEKIAWLWGPGNLTFQHDPRMLPNGNVLVFDNGIKKSQIVELEPLSLQVAWRYAPEAGFFSELSGAVQRLDNGDTLITESMKGYALEVTPAGEIVWKYANPEVDLKGVRNGIIRMTRVDRSALTFLPGAASASR